MSLRVLDPVVVRCVLDPDLASVLLVLCQYLASRSAPVITMTYVLHGRSEFQNLRTSSHHRLRHTCPSGWVKPRRYQTKPAPGGGLIHTSSASHTCHHKLPCTEPSVTGGDSSKDITLRCEPSPTGAAPVLSPLCARSIFTVFAYTCHNRY